MDGDASNNTFRNLGVNCTACDRVRHCGLAGMHGILDLYVSDMNQIEIVSRTRAHIKKHGVVPKPVDIDCNASHATMHMTEFANILLKSNYADLAPDLSCLRGFFSNESLDMFIRNV